MQQLPCALFATALIFAGESVCGQVTRDYTLVALQGEPAPSIGREAKMGIVGFHPRIGPNGHIVFGGFVDSNGVEKNYAIWTGRVGAIEPLVVKGDPAPGREGETMDVFFGSSGSPYWICSDGAVGFHARVLPSQDEGYWLGKPGSLEDVAIVNNDVPGERGATFKGFPPMLFQANGESDVILRAEMAGVSDSSNTAVWVGSPPNLEMLLREGEPAPGVGGATYGDLTFSELSLNAQAEYCVIAPLKNTPSRNNSGVFLGSRDRFLIAIQKGESIGRSDTWLKFGKPRLNDGGTLLLENAPLGEPRGFYTRQREGAVRRVAREQEIPPGAPNRTWDQFFFSKPALGGADQVAFNGGLAPGADMDRDGLWFFDESSVDLISQKGDPAPGFRGDTFNKFHPITFHRAPAINAEGTVVFRATTAGGKDGLWSWREGSTPELLLAVGDSLNLGPGDVRRVADFSVKLGSGGQSGEPSALNDCGQLVFQASFNSGRLGTAIMMIEDVNDCDGGGLRSLLEQAFGGDLTDPSDDDRVQPQIQRTVSGVVLQYYRRIDGSFTYEIEHSLDLQSWMTVALAQSLADDQSGAPAGTERVEAVIPVVAGEARHYRVRVTRAP